MKKRIINLVAFSFLGMSAFAQTGSSGLANVSNEVQNMIRDIVPIIKMIALVFLIWGVISLIIALATKSQDVKSKATYAVIGLVVYIILQMLTTQYGASSIGW